MLYGEVDLNISEHAGAFCRVHAFQFDKGGGVGAETVFLQEAVEALQVKAGDTIVDATVGGAGHFAALEAKLDSSGFLIGIEALLIGQKLGLEPGLMVDVLNASTGMNNSTQKKFRQFVLSRRFDLLRARTRLLLKLNGVLVGLI